ncbi:unnamed protein product [Brassica oleracea]
MEYKHLRIQQKRTSLVLTTELPVQEEERVTIAFDESIAQQIEQILELENLEEVYNSKITLHPNQMYIY